MSFLNNLQWRYATKKFDVSKKVSDEDRKKIIEAIRMAPTSYGLQPFGLKVIDDPALRSELRKNSWDQPQITDSSFIIVFSANINFNEQINGFIEMASGGNEEVKVKMKGYEDMMRGAVAKLSESEAVAWAGKQAYIALGFGLAACAELQIDSCPMEGFDAEKYKSILNLPKEYFPQVVLAVGYRAGDDLVRPKVRIPESKLLID